MNALRTLLPMAVLVLPATAAAQSYNVAQSTGSFASIAGTGTEILPNQDDDGAASLTLPFNFNFFGQQQPSGTSMTATTNGLLFFDTGSTAYDNVQIPSSSVPNGFIAAFWDDLTADTGGQIFYRSSGTTGSRVLTVEWSSFRFLGSGASNTFSMQVRLYEANGRIEILYGPQSGGAGTPAATIGVEDASGTVGAQTSCSPISGSGGCSFTDISSGTLFTFTPGAGPPPMRPDITVTNAIPDSTTITPGQTVNIEYEVRNIGGAASSSFDVSLFASPDPTVNTSDAVLASDSVSGISAGGSGGGTITFAVPVGTPSGTLYVALIADASNTVSEVDENNNVFNLGAVTIGGTTMGTIRVTTTSLPTGRVGSSYSGRIQATGSTSPTFAVISGSLPGGVSLASNGTLSGTPSASGTFPFRVQASQSGYTAGSADLVITVNGGGGGQLQLDTTMLPEAQVGTPFSATLAASGGSPPYAFQIISASPTRPTWLMMNSSGAMSGTPSGPGEYQLEISVFDSLAGSTSATLSLVVTEMRALEIVTTSLPNGSTNVSYSGRVEARGGSQPYMFSVSSGQLPAGLNLSSESGEITGTPTALGMSSFEITVRDSTEASVTRSFQVSIAMMTELHITSNNRITLMLNTSANVSLSAEGGTPPYEWAITAGALPDGLTLATDGRISGTATSSQAASLVVRVTDANRGSATQEITVQATSDGQPSTGDPNGVRRGGRGGAPTARAGGCATAGVPGPAEGSPLFGVMLLLAAATWRIRRGRSG